MAKEKVEVKDTEAAAPTQTPVEQMLLQKLAAMEQRLAEAEKRSEGAQGVKPAMVPRQPVKSITQNGAVRIDL